MLAPVSVSETSGRCDLTEYFEGRTKGWGIFENRFGRLKRRFTVDIDGYWDDGTFVMDETFAYDDGTDERRIWRLTPDGSGGFSGHAKDCVGAARGRVHSNATTLSYAFRLEIRGRRVTVRFDDRMYRVDGDVVVNRAVVSKWGIRLGEVSLFFLRQN